MHKKKKEKGKTVRSNTNCINVLFAFYSFCLQRESILQKKVPEEEDDPLINDLVSAFIDSVEGVVHALLQGIFCFVLFCFVLFCFVLFCFVLFCFVLFCFVLSCFVLSCFVLFCLVLSCFVLFCLVLSCFVLSCLVLSCLVFVK